MPFQKATLPRYHIVVNKKNRCKSCNHSSYIMAYNNAIGRNSTSTGFTHAWKEKYNKI